ncbi:hypothetical protein O181_016297 [Austropuccinia psidii MF-1]|uniref:Uncharacterized protein n=1 Tax=Austropuccinia psidii MF-1 TaxID=1389203 RepID=A0A9Q3C5C1_9BASI|nr:hypothetical protein [Austropuccinia psidii MF-1]
MSPVHLRNLGIPRNQPEDREGLSRTRIPGGRHLGHSGVWQNNEGDNINLAIHTPIQQKPQPRGLEGYRSSSSDPPTPQRLISMEHGQQEVQPSNSLGRTSQSQVVSRRRQGYKGKNKTSFNQRQRESDPMIQKLLELVKEVHKSKK